MMYLLYIILIGASFGDVKTQFEIDLPCPSVYLQEGKYGDHGLIKIKSPPLGQCLVVTVYMSTNKTVNKDFKGYLELLESREKILQQIINTKTLTYKIDFPYLVQPDLDYVTLNGKYLCARELKHKHLDKNRTVITAEHILYTDDKNIEFHNITKSICNERVDENYKIYNIKPGVKEDFVNIRRLYKNCGKTSENFNWQSEIVKPNNWPWLVMIFHKMVYGLNFLCTGTLISDKHIITAANCFEEKLNRRLTENDIMINLGAHDIIDLIDDKSVLTPALAIYIHPLYDKGLGLNHNLAIVAIEPITSSEYIHPICISYNLPDHNQHMMSGWLQNNKRDPIMTIPLQTTTQLRYDCATYFPFFKPYLTADSLCGEKNNKDALFTYGSGLYMPTNDGFWILRGVLSFNLFNITDKTPLQFNIYTNIPNYLVWIERVMKLTTEKTKKRDN